VTGRYEVRLTPPAVRALTKLPPRLADPVLRFLDQPMSDNPWRVTKPLGHELAGMRSGRVGVAFRVLVTIEDDNRVVLVHRIAQRADAYRAF